MNALNNVTRLLFACTLTCGVWVSSTANLAAQSTAVTQEPAMLSTAQPPLSESTGPMTLRESVRRAGAAGGPGAGPAAAGRSGDSGSKRTHLIVFGSLLLATDVATIVGDAMNDGVNFPESAVPVFGPFIALIRYDDVVVNPYYTGRNTDKVLFAASGIVQAACLAMIIRALVSKGSSEANSPKNARHFSLVPTDRHGLLLRYQARF